MIRLKLLIVGVSDEVRSLPVNSEGYKDNILLQTIKNIRGPAHTDVIYTTETVRTRSARTLPLVSPKNVKNGCSKGVTKRQLTADGGKGDVKKKQ